MDSFGSYITEQKNTHMTHIEDKVIYGGVKGCRDAIMALRSLRDMLGGEHDGNVSLKWDGAPAIFAGTDPSDGKFFVGTKGVFSKTGKLVKSTADLDKYGYSGGLRDKLTLALEQLPKLGIEGVLQGDMMYTKADLESADIDGEESWVFQPNTITYAVPKDSKLGKRIAASDMGIIFHTTYTGDSVPEMTATFGADVSGLNKISNVWVDDAVYKDLSGQAS